MGSAVYLASRKTVVGLGRVEIVALDPYTGKWRRLARVTSDDLAGRPRNMVSSEKLEHAMAVRVANGIR